MRVAIIGGGIAGLAAAYELEKGRAAGAEVEYTLFESREPIGRTYARLARQFGREAESVADRQ